MHNQKFISKLNVLLHISMFIMVAGFFTWSENVMVTRGLKVVGRLGVTFYVWHIYKMLLNSGLPSSFKWRNALSPLLYAAYLLLGLISIMWSTNPGYSGLQWLMDVECLLFAYYFMRSILLIEEHYPGSKIRFYNIMGNVTFILILIFLIGAVANPDDFFRLVEGGEDSRLGGYIMNPNELGMLCGLGVSCLIFDLYRQPKKWWTIFKISCIVVALVLTKSRSSLIGLLLVVFFHIRRSSNLKLKLLVYLSVAMAVPLAVEKLVMRKGGIDDILSMTGRMPFWKALITEGLPREPLLGFGFMRIDYNEVFESVHSYTAHMTHNTFIQVLMNLGFIGFGLVLFQMFFTIRGFAKESTEKKLMLFGILIPVLINSFTEFGIFGESNYGILFYQLLIFSISFGKVKELSKSEKLRTHIHSNTFRRKQNFHGDKKLQLNH
ncbi:MAG: O-antigen ligase family protein [Bacteroidia bacterium]|nr:O-antigen ligase family protein [Bacteroidia bacterium]